MAEDNPYLKIVETGASEEEDKAPSRKTSSTDDPYGEIAKKAPGPIARGIDTAVRAAEDATETVVDYASRSGIAAPFVQAIGADAVKDKVLGGIRRRRQRQDQAAAAEAEPKNTADFRGAGLAQVNRDDEAKSAERRKQAPAYKNRQEAIDDMVNLLDEGYDRAKVIEAANNLGIAEQELDAAARQRNPNPAPQPVVEPRDPNSRAVESGTIGQPNKTPAIARGIADFYGGRNVEPASPLEQGILTALQRGGTQMGIATDVLGTQLGTLRPETAGRRIAERTRTQPAYEADIQAGLEAINKSKTMGEAVTAAAANPKATIAMLVESLVASSPSFVAGPVGAVAGPGGAAVAAGATSFAIEFSSSLVDFMQDHGMNPADPVAIARMLNDQTMMEQAREYAVQRGVPVATFDALSAGIAGKFLGPVIQKIESGALKGRAAVGKVAGASVLEAGMQAGAGAAGELGGQYVAGQDYQPADALFEMLAELPGGVAETAGNIYHQMGQRAGRGSPGEPPAGGGTPADLSGPFTTVVNQFTPVPGAEGQFKAPNGAIVTPDQWDAASPRVRAGWMQASEDSVSRETPEGMEVTEGEDITAAPAPAEETRATELRRLADQATDPAVRADLLRRAAEEDAAVKRVDDGLAQADELERLAGEATDPGVRGELQQRAAKLRAAVLPKATGIKVEEHASLDEAVQQAEEKPSAKGIKVEELPVEEAGEIPEVDEFAPPSGERRRDGERRQKVAEMSPEQMRQELLTSPVAGIGNKRAWEEAPRRAVQTNVDVDSLKWVNDNLGHDAGDQMLKAVGEAFREAGAEAYHLSGDEFRVQAGSTQEASATMRKVNAILAKKEVSVTLPDGTVITKKGIGVSHGHGSTVDEAERALQKSKSERQKKGVRPERGAEPRGVDRRQPGSGSAPGGAGVGERRGVAGGNGRGQKGEPQTIGQSPLFQKLVDTAGGLHKDVLSEMNVDSRKSGGGAARFQMGGKRGELFRTSDGLRHGDDIVEWLEQHGYLSQAEIDEANANRTGGAIDLAHELLRRELENPGSVVPLGKADDQAAARYARQQRFDLESEARRLGLDDSLPDDQLERAILDKLEAEWLDRSGLTISDAAKAARINYAMELDDGAVERAAIQFADDEPAFMRAIQDIIDGNGQATDQQRQGNEPAAGAQVPGREGSERRPEDRQAGEGRRQTSDNDQQGNGPGQGRPDAASRSPQQSTVAQRDAEARSRVARRLNARLRAEAAALWYSPLQRAVEALKADKAPAQQWINTIAVLKDGEIQSVKLKGATVMEVEWSGVLDWLALQGDRKITKDEVLGFIRNNGLDLLEERWRGDRPRQVNGIFDFKFPEPEKFVRAVFATEAVLNVDRHGPIRYRVGDHAILTRLDDINGVGGAPWPEWIRNGTVTLQDGQDPISLPRALAILQALEDTRKLNIAVVEGKFPEPDLVGPLIAEYDAWMSENGFEDDEIQSAEDMLAKENLTSRQRRWIHDYIDRWERAVRTEREYTEAIRLHRQNKPGMPPEAKYIGGTSYAGGNLELQGSKKNSREITIGLPSPEQVRLARAPKPAEPPKALTPAAQAVVANNAPTREAAQRMETAIARNLERIDHESFAGDELWFVMDAPTVTSPSGALTPRIYAREADPENEEHQFLTEGLIDDVAELDGKWLVEYMEDAGTGGLVLVADSEEEARNKVALATAILQHPELPWVMERDYRNIVDAVLPVLEKMREENPNRPALFEPGVQAAPAALPTRVTEQQTLPGVPPFPQGDAQQITDAFVAAADRLGETRFQNAISTRSEIVEPEFDDEVDEQAERFLLTFSNANGEIHERPTAWLYTRDNGHGGLEYGNENGEWFESRYEALHTSFQIQIDAAAANAEDGDIYLPTLWARLHLAEQTPVVPALPAPAAVAFPNEVHFNPPTFVPETDERLPGWMNTLFEPVLVVDFPGLHAETLRAHNFFFEEDWPAGDRAYGFTVSRGEGAPAWGFLIHRDQDTGEFTQNFEDYYDTLGEAVVQELDYAFRDGEPALIPWRERLLDDPTIVNGIVHSPEEITFDHAEEAFDFDREWAEGNGVTQIISYKVGDGYGSAWIGHAPDAPEPGRRWVTDEFDWFATREEALKNIAARAFETSFDATINDSLNGLEARGAAPQLPAPAERMHAGEITFGSTDRLYAFLDAVNEHDIDFGPQGANVFEGEGLPGGPAISAGFVDLTDRQYAALREIASEFGGQMQGQPPGQHTGEIIFNNEADMDAAIADHANDPELAGANIYVSERDPGDGNYRITFENLLPHEFENLQQIAAENAGRMAGPDGVEQSANRLIYQDDNARNAVAGLIAESIEATRASIEEDAFFDNVFTQDSYVQAMRDWMPDAEWQGAALRIANYIEARQGPSPARRVLLANANQPPQIYNSVADARHFGWPELPTDVDNTGLAVVMYRVTDTIVAAVALDDRGTFSTWNNRNDTTTFHDTFSDAEAALANEVLALDHGTLTARAQVAGFNGAPRVPGQNFTIPAAPAAPVLPRPPVNAAPAHPTPEELYLGEPRRIKGDDAEAWEAATNAPPPESADDTLIVYRPLNEMHWTPYIVYRAEGNYFEVPLNDRNTGYADTIGAARRILVQELQDGDSEFIPKNATKVPLLPESDRAAPPLARTRRRFNEGHFSEPDVLLHFRVNERIDRDGKRVLFVEEIQSDWAQKARKKIEGADGIERVRGFEPKAGDSNEQKIKALQKERDRLRTYGMTMAQLADYFKEGEIVGSSNLGGQRDKVLAFHKPENDNDHWWVRVVEVDLNGRPRGRSRVHSTPPTDELVRRIELEMQALRNPNALPRGPWVMNTEAWTALAVRRIIKMAVDEGFDRVAFTNGDQQNARYNLARVVSAIGYKKNADGTWHLGYRPVGAGPNTAFQNHIGNHDLSRLPNEKLTDAVPDEVARRIRAGEGTQRGGMTVLEGEGLQVGGKGMRGYYDNVLPKTINKILAKLGGGKVIDIPLALEGSYDPSSPIGDPNARVYFETSDGTAIVDPTADVQHGEPILRDVDPFSSAGQAMLIDYWEQEGVEANTVVLALSQFREDQNAQRLGLERADARGVQPGFEITPEMREMAQQGMPLARKKPPLPYPVPRLPDAKSEDELKGRLQAIRQTLDDHFGSDLIDALIDRGILRFETSEESRSRLSLLPDVMAVMSERDARGPGASFFYDRINPAYAPRLLMHEIGEHYGMWRMLGDDGYFALLRKVNNAYLRRSDPEINAAWQRVLRDYVWEDGRPMMEEGSDEFVREVAALVIETAPNRGWVREVLDAIKAWLYRLVGLPERAVDSNLLRGLASQALRKAASAPMPDRARAIDDARAAIAPRSREMDRISPRYARAVSSTENPLRQNLQPDLATALRDIPWIRHNLDVMAMSAPDVRGLLRAGGTQEQRARRVIDHFKRNILALHDAAVAEGFDQRAKQWYIGGNRIAHRFANRFGITPRQAAAVIAAFSPQRDWFQNVSMAERVLSAIHEHQDKTISAEMMTRLAHRDWIKALPRADVARLAGKSLRQVWGEGTPQERVDAARWIRAWDELMNPKRARVISPEGEFLAQWDVTKEGEPIEMRWSSMAPVYKTFALLIDGSRANISRVVGNDHKVRSFYNNIIAPDSPSGDVTIDTHAMAAAHWSPFGGSDEVVEQGFGGGVVGRPKTKASDVSGLSGNYFLYAEAYREAAQERGILPREMQSITWEAVRGLFRPGQKKGLKDQVATIWRNYAAGTISEDQARAQITQLARGIEPPKWTQGSGGGAAEATEASSYAEELSGGGLAGRADAAARRGAGAAARGTAAAGRGLDVESLATRRYQWMKNARGGQTEGNKQITVPLTKEVFDAYLKGKLRKDLQSFDKYRKAFPGTTHIGLFKRADMEEWQLVGGYGEDEQTLAPRPPDPRWVMEVDSFDSPAAVHQRNFDDEDLPPRDSVGPGLRAIFNLPDAPARTGIRSRAQPTPPVSTNNLDAEDAVGLLQRKFFDRFNRVRELQARLPNISDDMNVVQADTLYYGRAQFMGEELERQFIDPLAKALKAAKAIGLTVADADDFLMARHAPERNREMARRNPAFAQGGGSGMTDPQAASVMGSFNAAQRQALDRIAAIVDAMNADKLRRLETSGLITPALANTLRNQYQFYVPLKSLEEEDATNGVGRGYEVRNPGVEMAFGRASKASSPIAASLMDAARSIVLAEKARVDKVLWNLAGDPAVQDVLVRMSDALAQTTFTRQRYNPTTRQIETIVDTNWRNREDIMRMRIDGEEVHLWVRDDLLRDQLRKVATTNDPGAVLRAVGRVTGTIGRTLTEFNPAFTLPNGVKDALGTFIRARGIDRVRPRAVMANIPLAWKMILDFKRDKNTPGAQLYREFQEDGAKTGAYGITDYVDTLHHLEKLGAELGYPGKSRGVGTTVWHALGKVAHLVSHGNEVIEYATRLALYAEARHQGYTRQQAAVWAKEISVNFNRSGEYGRTMNSVFVFANAALQGLYGTIMFGKSHKVRMAMLGLVVLGAAAQAWNEIGGGDDDDTGDLNVNTLSDHALDNNATVLAPGSSKGVKIPLPPEYSFLYATGRRLYRAMSQGDVKKEAAGITGAFLGSVLPVRAPDASSVPVSAIKAVTPTTVLPFMDIAVNEDFRGAPIVPEQRNKQAPQPYPVLARQKTSDVAKAAAELLNTATGGDRIEPGLAQDAFGPFVSPEAMEHIVGYYTGGLGQFVMQSTNMGKALAGDAEALDVNKVPIANRFIFTQPQGYVARRYRELAPKFQYAIARERDGTTTEKIDPEVAAALDEYRAAERELRPLFAALRRAGEEGDDTQKKELEGQIRQVQTRVIKAYNDAKGAVK